MQRCTTRHPKAGEMNEAKDGYKLLARLRGLEHQLHRLRRDWKSFRDNPSHDALSDLRSHSRRLSEALDDLADGLEPTDAPTPSPTPQEPGPVRPAPRIVVNASRDLDARIWEATRQWKGLTGGDDPAHLEGLVSTLQTCSERAGTLAMALGGPASRRSGSARSRRGGPEDTVDAMAAELHGMLWRLKADWQRVRSAPSSDRLRLLQEGFGAAAEVALGLRELRGRVGESRFRRSLRVGSQLTDGVRFLPWRDPFTGAYNREGFEALAGAELKRCRRYGRPFGLLMLEISAPDLMSLQRAVATVRAELREYDLVARSVDDLILIGVPEQGGGPTRRVASRVIRSLRAAGFGDWFRGLSYATLPEDGSTLSGLTDEARGRLQP